METNYTLRKVFLFSSYCRVLTVKREKLMKEIWEDKGLVVISRNVDVMVSELRKKLADDPSIKIVNVPGRGYKFITE